MTLHVPNIDLDEAYTIYDMRFSFAKAFTYLAMFAWCLFCWVVAVHAFLAWVKP